MKDNMQGLEKVKTTTIYKLLGSKIFFQICAFLIVVGTAWFIYFSFIERDDSNNKVLQQLIANNDQVIELRGEVNSLKNSICVLQNQIESLGAIPAIEKDADCQSILNETNKN